MELKEFKNGNLYFLDEKYFNFLNDPKIKQNKNSSRPWAFAFEDKENGLLWFIPCSSKVDKFSEIIEARKREKKKHNHIHIIKIQGKKEVFLLRGGISRWKEKGYRLSVEETKISKGDKLSLNINDNMIADIQDVRKAIDDKEAVIVDSRTSDRYMGEIGRAHV